MNLKDLVKKQNIGLKIKYKDWPIDHYAVIEKVTTKSFYLKYVNPNQIVSRRFSFGVVMDEGWTICNSSIIKERLGIK